ncbi:MAG: TonB-dependent receptor plug domain-containing protein, partial [Polymorphobacter sp.]
MNVINGLKLFLFASTALSQVAYAQAAAGNAPAPAPAPQAEAPTVEADIVVTAQRREGRLLDVPIAVSVINPALMERAGFQNINNIQAFVPNLQINQTVGNSVSPLITIRGLSPSSDTSLARDQPVGIYLDGV